MNKRGQIGMIIFFAILFMVLIIAFIASISVGLFDYVSDTVTPIMEDLGVVGETNLSEAATYTFGTMNTVIQNLPWLVGFGYVCALIFSIVFVISYETNPSPVFIGLYIMFILLLIVGAIIISNSYQDIYTGTDELATRLQEQTLLSYMILYSPMIIALIAFITGIYLFSRPSEATGGFGV